MARERRNIRSSRHIGVWASALPSDYDGLCQMPGGVGRATSTDSHVFLYPILNANEVSPAAIIITMKHALFKPLLIVFCHLAVLSASGQSFVENGLEYTILSQSDKRVEVSGTSENLYGDIVIPEKTNSGYKVTSIGKRAFTGSLVRTVTIPYSVMYIADEAFMSALFLSSVEIPESVINIGRRAFLNCKALTSITIPNTIRFLSDEMFSQCTSLISVILPNSLHEIDIDAFNGCSSLKSVTMPTDYLSFIGDGAFRDCHSLTSITMPSWLDRIGPEAFFGCSSLASVTLPYSLGEIGDRAFMYDQSLTSIAIPSSVFRIGECAFANTDLNSIEMPNSVTEIGEDAFRECYILRTVVISDAIEYIPSRCFENCSALENITLSRNLKTIHKSAFDGTGTKTISCYALIPPKVVGSSFSNPINHNDWRGVLYVPRGSGYLYDGIFPWSLFSQIHETLEESGIDGIDEDADTPEIVGAVDLQGRPIDKDASGLVILKYSDGSVKKVINK